MSDQHWHALIGSHLDQKAVQLNATPPVPTAHEARDRIVKATRMLAETMPFVARLADELAAMQPEDCHAILLTAGFTVLPCSGSEESECVRTIDREAEEMIKAYETKEFIQMMSIFMESLAADDEEPGGYL